MDQSQSKNYVVQTENDSPRIPRAFIRWVQPDGDSKRKWREALGKACGSHIKLHWNIENGEWKVNNRKTEHRYPGSHAHAQSCLMTYFLYTHPSLATSLLHFLFLELLTARKSCTFSYLPPASQNTTVQRPLCWTQAMRTKLQLTKQLHLKMYFHNFLAMVVNSSIPVKQLMWANDILLVYCTKN